MVSVKKIYSKWKHYLTSIDIFPFAIATICQAYLFLQTTNSISGGWISTILFGGCNSWHIFQNHNSKNCWKVIEKMVEKQKQISDLLAIFVILEVVSLVMGTKQFCEVSLKYEKIFLSKHWAIPEKSQARLRTYFFEKNTWNF